MRDLTNFYIGVIMPPSDILMTDESPLFFGLVVLPNKTYKATINDSLLITKVTIAPDAKPDQYGRIFVSINKKEIPLVHLDGKSCVSSNVSLKIPSDSFVEVCFRVVGNAAVHVSGYFSSQY